MNVHQPEMHATGFRALVDEGTRALGPERVAKILEDVGISLAELTDPAAWFSLELAETLIARLEEATGDRLFLDRMAASMLAPKNLGVLYPLVRALGTPAFTYTQLVSLAGRFNKVAAIELLESQSGRVRLRYRTIEGAARESGSFMCRSRIAQFAAIPTLFDLPRAEVEHPECMGRGDAACIYDIKWQEPRPRWRSHVAFLFAGTLGFALAQHFHLANAVAGACAFGLGAFIWALVRVAELRKELQARIGDIAIHREALTRSAQANERRYEELLEAKAEVEKKVEERTAELRDTSLRLSETLAQVRALDLAKTEFFNNVSHELRSPLTLLLAPLADLVANRAPPGGRQAAFDAMHRNASRLLRLINQLLDLAKIDAGQMKIAPRLVDLVALLRAAAKGFEAAAEKKGVRLEVQAPERMALVALDATLIESAVTNLLANALRLTPSGGSVRVTARDLGSEVAISVADDGPGIALDEQAKIFERFAQGDSATRVIGGTGIGLALVREAVRLHGGDVSLVSELGKGATFTLIVPRRAESQFEGMPQDAPLEVASAPFVDDIGEYADALERVGPAPNAPLALVVEDNPELRVFIANVLAVRYRVRAVSDGAQALALLPDLRPDVVVSDVAMPVMDGYALCRKLRADPQTSSIPVLLVTARTEEGSVLAGFEAGASDYVLKPFHGRELLARVDAHVRLRRMAQELVLRERHAMLGVLAASVAHQVRNPLTTLVSGLPAMRARLDGRVSPSTFELIDLMMECASRIERLTGDLVDLSRVDREEGGDFRPSDGLQSAIRMVRARVPDNVVIEDHVEASPIIQGRPGDVNHVFMNVLDNAVRAVAAGGKVTVDAALRAESYVVRIADDGPGVEPSVAERIFEPFFTTRAAGEGTGLGLAIAQQVMQQCGGSIRVGRSHLGGAEFVIEMPLGGRVASESGLLTAAREALH